MEEKRMANDYEILHSIHIGKQELVLGYSPENKDGMKYMTAYCQQNELYTLYSDALVSENYPEIMEIFGNRIAEQAAKVKEEMAQETEEVFDNRPFDSVRCGVIPGCKVICSNDDLKGKIVIINPESLRFEYRATTHQLMYCTGGFGSYPNSRGSACFCTNLYTGQHTRFERRDILATMEEAALPQWAKDGLKKIKEHHKTETKKDEAER